MDILTTNHYSSLLQLQSPWGVEEVTFQQESEQIKVKITYSSNAGECPECKTVCPVYDRRSERSWRHLNTMQYETYLRCRIPRVRCEQCGVRSLKIPWSESHNGFTLLFEDYAIDVLIAGRSVEEARKLLGVNWHQLNGIKQRAVARGLKRRKKEDVEYVGIDEKSFRSGHRYASMLNDLSRSRVLDVVESRTEEACAKLIKQGLSAKQRKSVKGVAIDMWQAYINAVTNNLPDADIVHDRFHISKHMNDAVDKTRRREHRGLMKDNDESLKGLRYKFVSNAENIDQEHFDMLEEIYSGGLKTGRAWVLKELFRDFWDYNTKGWAENFFKRWYSKAIRSRIEPVKQVARMLKTHLDNILTYFTHRITNAISEGINSKVQTVQSNARGFHTFNSYRISVLFFCGKLQLKHYISH